MIVPSDSSHDFTPIAPADVAVGQECVFQYEIAGEITTLYTGLAPTYIFVITNAEGETANGYIIDGAGGSTPWETIYLYRRTPKPAQGTLFTAADGSRWVYPGQPHGLYRCWQAGTTHNEGLMHRALIDGLVEG